MCWIPLYPGYPDGEPIKREEKMYRPTIEDRLEKLEDELSFVKLWEDDMDTTVDEIEKRLTNLEKENIDGR